MRNSKMRNLADAYREILDGRRIEEIGLDPDSIKKLELFMLHVDRDMLQTELTKITGLSHSSIYKLKKVRSEHAASKV
jgi:transcriptional antiterminator Rof (Rho-off)